LGKILVFRYIVLIGSAGIMSVDQDQVQVKDDEPSRRNFLKVSVVAGATVAALAAGAGMLPKLASSAATSGATAASASSAKQEQVSLSSGKPLILVLNGDSVDVYQGEAKFPLKDSVFAREIASRVNERVQ
jgi:hypothetical protein